MNSSPAQPPAVRNLAFDHLEFYVGNAKQAAHYYCTAFGFEPVGYRGPETGVYDRVSYAIRQRDLWFVLTAALDPQSPIAEHVALHGDGVRDIALAVDDARAAFTTTVGRGARAIADPWTISDRDGRVVCATIGTYGDTVHTLVERGAYSGPFLPGFVPWTGPHTPSVGLTHIDHCVGNVGWNEMDTWVRYYERAFGFTQLISFDDRDISTEFTALKSKVVTDANHRVTLPINEPAHGKKRSQIEEYLTSYGGPGVQHIAIASEDIIATVRALRANGVELLASPAAYYTELAERIGAIDEDLAVLRELNILVDRDDRGYMLQIFTKPLQDRPTVFFEIIQRRGSLSFGKGNFKALFVSIEAEQAKRGAL